MKSRVILTVTYEPETGNASFPEDLNRWPFILRVRLFQDIADMIADRLDDAL